MSPAATFGVLCLGCASVPQCTLTANVRNMKWLGPSEALLSAWREAEQTAFGGVDARRVRGATARSCATSSYDTRPIEAASGCGARPAAYEHASAAMPDWWVDVDVPVDRLSHDPAWLDDHWNEEWLERQPLRP